LSHPNRPGPPNQTCPRNASFWVVWLLATACFLVEGRPTRQDQEPAVAELGPSHRGPIPCLLPQTQWLSAPGVRQYTVPKMEQLGPPLSWPPTPNHLQVCRPGVTALLAPDRKFPCHLPASLFQSSRESPDNVLVRRRGPTKLGRSAFFKPFMQKKTDAFTKEGEALPHCQPVVRVNGKGFSCRDRRVLLPINRRAGPPLCGREFTKCFSTLILKSNFRSRVSCLENGLRALGLAKITSTAYEPLEKCL